MVTSNINRYINALTPRNSEDASVSRTIDLAATPVTLNESIIPEKVKAVQVTSVSMRELLQLAGTEHANVVPADYDVGKLQSYMDLILDMAKNGKVKADEILPLLLKLRPDQPLSLARYPQAKAMYHPSRPVESILVAGRQVSKSVTLANTQVLRAASLPGYRILTCTPLYQQVYRFSSEYIAAAIKFMTIKEMITDPSCVDNLLKKTFSTGSSLTFGYCFNGVDRLRGVAADELNLDEVQDIDPDYIPILQQCLKASPIRLHNYSGTPKTDDHATAALWDKSSQGEWVIPCKKCSHENVPSENHDIFKMIGKWNEEKGTGLQCAQCGYPINTYDGRYVHMYPERIPLFLGLHWPQIIFPLHCCDPRAWQLLLAEINTASTAVVYNEVLGLTYNAGSKIIPKQAVDNASKLPWSNFDAESSSTLQLIKSRGYIIRALGVDWGGHGEKGDSVTAISVIGLRTNGTIDVIYLEELPPSDTDNEEHDRIKYLYHKFGCSLVGHDFNGVGESKDSMLKSIGTAKIFRWCFVTGNAKFFISPTADATGRTKFNLNRTSAILLLGNMVTSGRVEFTRPVDASSVSYATTRDLYHLPHRLTAWFENYISTPTGRTSYQIQRAARASDDVGMAIIFGSLACFYYKNQWPKYAKSLNDVFIGSATELEHGDEFGQ